MNRRPPSLNGAHVRLSGKLPVEELALSVGCRCPSYCPGPLLLYIAAACLSSCIAPDSRIGLLALVMSSGVFPREPFHLSPPITSNLLALLPAGQEYTSKLATMYAISLSVVRPWPTLDLTSGWKSITFPHPPRNSAFSGKGTDLFRRDRRLPGLDLLRRAEFVWTTRGGLACVLEKAALHATVNPRTEGHLLNGVLNISFAK